MLQFLFIFWVHFKSFKIFSSEQSLYSALNILLLDLKSVKCVCIETAQTWTYFTYFTYFIYIDIHNRTIGDCMNWYSNTILLYLLKKRNMQQLTMDNTKYDTKIYWKEDHVAAIQKPALENKIHHAMVWCGVDTWIMISDVSRADFNLVQQTNTGYWEQRSR